MITQDFRAFGLRKIARGHGGAAVLDCAGCNSTAGSEQFLNRRDRLGGAFRLSITSDFQRLSASRLGCKRKRRVEKTTTDCVSVEENITKS
jgi:hypothetical protein